MLDFYVFNTLTEVREITEDWIKDYNEQRPHEALGQMTPAEFLVAHSQTEISPMRWHKSGEVYKSPFFFDVQREFRHQGLEPHILTFQLPHPRILLLFDEHPMSAVEELIPPSLLGVAWNYDSPPH